MKRKFPLAWLLPLLFLAQLSVAYWPTTPEEQLIIEADSTNIAYDIRERCISLTSGRTLLVWNEGPAVGPPTIMYQIVDKFGEFLFPEHQILADSVTYYKAISDGEGGAVISLFSGENEGYVWVQHLDSLGNKLWGDTGRVVAQGQYATSLADIVKDPVNEEYFVLLINPNPNFELMCQRLNVYGYPIWPGNGMVVADSGANYGITSRYNQIAPDLNGGAYAVWKTAPAPNYYDKIYIQHLDASGNRLWGDPAWGLLLYDPPGMYWYKYPEIISDGAGGAIVCDTDHFLRMNYSGNIIWQVNITGAQDYTFLHPGDSGDFYATWLTAQYNGYARATRLSLNGAFLWPGQYVQLSSLQVEPDNDIYGAFYQDGYLFGAYRHDNGRNVITQKVDSMGNLQWGATGINTAFFTSLPTDLIQIFRGACSDQAGGLITMFHTGSGWADLYAKRVLADGTLGGDLLPISDLQISIAGEDILLSWNPCPPASQYDVYISDEPYIFPATPSATVADTTYIDAGAVNSGVRFYRVTWRD